MSDTNQTPELSAFNRYVTLLEEQDRISDDIKRLAGLSVKGRIGKEVLKFRALQDAAARCEQLKLFKEL